MTDNQFRVIREKILKAIEIRKTNKNQVSKACNLNRGNFNNFLKGKQYLSIAKLEIVLKHLGIELKIKEDISDKGYITERPADQGSNNQ